MAKLILLNGPPRCGKDTLAAGLMNELNDPTAIAPLAGPLRAAALLLTGFSEPLQWGLYDEIKDAPLPILEDREPVTDPTYPGDPTTLRGFMIRLSEAFVKGIYGKDYWGRLLLVSHPWVTDPTDPRVLIVPDLGFASEYEFLSQHVDPVVIHIEREGCTFDRDSRNWVYPKYNHGFISLVNNGSPEDLVADALQTLAPFDIR